MRREVMETASGATVSRSGGIADVVDRFFPVIWLGLYLLLPVSGWADLMFVSWYDQQRDLETLRDVIERGESATIDENKTSLGYIALAALLHDVFGLSPESSLVALTRASYALSIAGGMALVRMFVRRLAGAPPAASLAAQFVYLALAFAAVTWFWSDVPWSHFLAACLGVLLFAARYLPSRLTVVGAGIAGTLWALLLLARSFEAVALLLAWAIALALFIVLGTARWKLPPAQHLVTGSVAFVATAVVVHLRTGKRDPFLLYSSGLSRQSGDLPEAEVADTPTFSPLLVPVKLVQLFVEPCFYSMCRLSDYAGTAEPLTGPLADASGQERLWRLPLALQLPSLVLLPVSVAAVGALVFWLARRRPAAVARTREIRLLAEMTIASCGLVLGYAASTLTGSSHLRYGFARDFLLPAALAGVVAVSIGAAGSWVLVRSSGVRLWPAKARLSADGVMVLGALVVAVAIGAGAWVGRTYGLPRIEGRQLGVVQYTALCRNAVCDIGLEARAVSGERITIPTASVLTFGCGADDARFSVYVRRPAEGVRLDDCVDPRLVAAWPTVMGLPPGRPQLYAVDVVNAP